MHTYAAYACQVYTFKTFQNKDRTKINKANHCRDKHSHTVAIRQIFQLQNALHWLFNHFVIISSKQNSNCCCQLFLCPFMSFSSFTLVTSDLRPAAGSLSASGLLKVTPPFWRNLSGGRSKPLSHSEESRGSCFQDRFYSNSSSK